MTVQDRIEMAKELAEVRKSGEANMFDREDVKIVLAARGYLETAYYIQENKQDYLSLLDLSGDY